MICRLIDQIHQTEEKLSEEKTLRESLQIQMKLLEEENIDLREIMTQMRKRRHDELNWFVFRFHLEIFIREKISFLAVTIEIETIKFSN